MHAHPRSPALSLRLAGPEQGSSPNQPQNPIGRAQAVINADSLSLQLWLGWLAGWPCALTNGPGHCFALIGGGGGGSS